MLFEHSIFSLLFAASIVLSISLKTCLNYWTTFNTASYRFINFPRRFRWELGPLEPWLHPAVGQEWQESLSSRRTQSGHWRHRVKLLSGNRSLQVRYYLHFVLSLLFLNSWRKKWNLTLWHLGRVYTTRLCMIHHKIVCSLRGFIGSVTRSYLICVI